MSEITITPVGAVDALYCKYPGQFNVQPVDLRLDTRTGVLSCDYNPGIGHIVSFDEFHHLILTAPIDPLTADSANRLMQEVAPLAGRVMAGASEEWNGNDDVGRLTDDAATAWDEITTVCRDWSGEDMREQVCGWDVSDWFAEGDDITIVAVGLAADTTDEQIAAIAAEQSETATTGGECGYSVLDADDVATYLTGLRAGLRETVREELTDAAEALEAATRRRDGLLRQIRQWAAGDTLRSLGDLAGVSHTEVARIVTAGQ